MGVNDVVNMTAANNFCHQPTQANGQQTTSVMMPQLNSMNYACNPMSQGGTTQSLNGSVVTPVGSNVCQQMSQMNMETGNLPVMNGAVNTQNFCNPPFQVGQQCTQALQNMLVSQQNTNGQFVPLIPDANAVKN